MNLPPRSALAAPPVTQGGPALLVAQDDLAAFTELALPIAPIVVARSGTEYTLSDSDGGRVPIEVAFLRAIARLGLGEAGRSVLEGLGVAWAQAMGTEPPPLVPVGPAGPDRAGLGDWLIARVVASRQDEAQRSVALMREMDLLRRQHEVMQASFRGLEQFVFGHDLQHRRLDLSLSPVVGQLPITLQPGAELSLRLPGGSPGLSDIALHLPDEPALAEAEAGMLRAILSSPDSGETLAIWQVPAGRMRPGWLRLALDRALGPDPVTLVLTLVRQGPGAMRLSGSIRHPEERFQPVLDGDRLPLLPALQTWRWVAGAAAPLPAEAIQQVGGGGRLWRVDRDLLATARDWHNPQHHLPLIEEGSAVMVHVLTDRTACGVLAGVALPGTRHVTATAMTRHADGPEVDYQIALVPRQPGGIPGGALPALDPALASGWVRLSPMQEGQLHLLAAEPLDAPHDLLLMTRLPEGATSNAFGWTTFANIGLQS
jgi:hypothetical protein